MRYCANCTHWYCYNEKNLEKYGGCAEGECRRYPPYVPCIEGEKYSSGGVNASNMLIHITMGTMLVSYPFTNAEEWCGEFDLMDNPRWTE